MGASACSQSWHQLPTIITRCHGRLYHAKGVSVAVQAMQERRREHTAAEPVRLAHTRLQRGAIVAGWVGLGFGAGYLALNALRGYQSRHSA